MTQQTFNKQVKTFIRICIILYTILGIMIITFSFNYLQERKKSLNNKDKSRQLLDNSEYESELTSRTMTHSKNISLSEKEFNMIYIYPNEGNVITIPTSSIKLVNILLLYQ